ncbi:uncharacterized protein LOC131840919 isoform X2 [Achroia grisella]|uniref:uncharacterized protein LOC131840919 isoform X2 n=1 Tax=Achroia grisella TaxID=688607 RepID=UPI0027D1FD7D|nr:uncharacterized protein LOC131840919 isoform X2 [Achroia grisella]
MTRQISFDEVKKHNNKDSVWIVIHNDVYDVTSYLEEHPGGEEALLDVAGKDGTQAFEDVGHSEDARTVMKKFKIGTLPPSEQSGSSNVTNCCKEIKKKLPSSDKTPVCKSCSATRLLLLRKKYCLIFFSYKAITFFYIYLVVHVYRKMSPQKKLGEHMMDPLAVMLHYRSLNTKSLKV